MFDTVNFKLSRAEVDGVDFLEEIPRRLDSNSVAFHDYNGVLSVTGELSGLRVTANSFQVGVKDGSLCKWMMGDNYQTMTRADAQQAVERLSDTLHVPMERAIITRLDVGVTMAVSEPVANYLNHLGLLNYAKRFQQGEESLYYYRHRQSERLCFYDKNREQRDKHRPIPEDYESANVLRYEQRYMSRLPKLLGVEAVTASMLYDERFYNMLLDRWGDTYGEIRKINDKNINFQAMKTKRDLQRIGVLALIEQWGGELAVIGQINEAQKSGILTKKQAYDLRQSVKDACKVREDLTAPNEAISELDRRIIEVVESFRC